MKLNKSKMRIRSSQGQKMSLKQVMVLSTSFLVLLSLGLVLFINLGDNRLAYGASSSGDYKSKATGNWNATGTWSKYSSSWANATATPTNSDNVITISSGYTVTITASVTADQIVVASGGVLVINSGVTLTLNNGSGTDLDVSGTVKNAGTITLNSSATMVVQSGGVYQHNSTSSAGAIPTATWSSGSTCEIAGYTTASSPPTGLGQSFSNFTWNCPSQSSDINFSAALTSVSGIFTVASTGSKTLKLLAGNGTATFGDDVNISGGEVDVLKNSGTSITINVGGDLNVTGGVLTLSESSGSTASMNISGNYNQTGGIFSVMTGSNSTGTVNLSGNMSQTGGTLTVGGNSATSAGVVFKKSGTQTYTDGGTVSGNLDFTVNSGSNLVLSSSDLIKGRNFTLSAGGTLSIGSTAGITSSGATGNIQSSGTRSFSIDANYIFNGTAAQVTGNGFPSQVMNLTMNNSTGLTLSATVAVKGILTLTTGDIKTGSYEVNVINSSQTAITSHSANSYINGNLRRTMAATGSFDFPIGTAANYEFVNVKFTGVTGTSTLLAKFTNASPITASLPLVGVIVNNLTIDKSVSYGYWTLTPNLPVLLGNYTITATEIASATAVNSGCSYTLLNRLTSLLPWSSYGTQSSTTQTVSGNAITAARSGCLLFGDFSIGYGEFLSFYSPILISGTDGAIGATYRFDDACSNVDAWIEIKDLTNGASLDNIDNFTGNNGYDEGWQPFINTPGNKTSSILWKISFKVKGTTTDKILPWLAITGIDIDAGTGIQEFVEATYPYSYGLSTGTPLTVTNNNGTYRATAASSVGSISSIDTAKYQAMWQINYKNVNSFLYRTGVISTKSGSEVRQNSLYFKSFFTNNLALPIKLLSFDATLKDKKVNLMWVTGTETNNNLFTVERSADGVNFEPVSKQRGAGNSTTTLYYSDTDYEPLPGYSYYRLKQTDFNGQSSYSETQTVKNADDNVEGLVIKSIAPNPFTESFSVNFITKAKDMVSIVMMNSTGQIVAQEEVVADEGFNSYQFPNMAELSRGVYFVTIMCRDQKVTQKIIRK